MSLSCSSALHHVVGLEVAVGQPLRVQVAESRRDLDDVGDGLFRGQGTVVRLADLLERRAADVLHDDVAERHAGGIDMLDEVVDPDDVRVLDFGQRVELRRRRPPWRRRRRNSPGP